MSVDITVNKEGLINDSRADQSGLAGLFSVPDSPDKIFLARYMLFDPPVTTAIMVDLSGETITWGDNDYEWHSINEGSNLDEIHALDGNRVFTTTRNNDVSMRISEQAISGDVITRQGNDATHKDFSYTTANVNTSTSKAGLAQMSSTRILGCHYVRHSVSGHIHQVVLMSFGGSTTFAIVDSDTFSTSSTLMSYGLVRLSSDRALMNRWTVDHTVAVIDITGDSINIGSELPVATEDLGISVSPFRGPGCAVIGTDLVIIGTGNVLKVVKAAGSSVSITATETLTGDYVLDESSLDPSSNYLWSIAANPDTGYGIVTKYSTDSLGNTKLQAYGFRATETDITIGDIIDLSNNVYYTEVRYRNSNKFVAASSDNDTALVYMFDLSAGPATSYATFHFGFNNLANSREIGP